ncbi:hypothetical protein IPG41_01140 [Candidatus Peregrinibacteria bacterium]|nr:MAG: hypothetical protein IPG41_01140 [Candidatus Peregrinibacteria bacterium]
MKRLLAFTLFFALCLTGCAELSDFKAPAPRFDTLSIAYAEPLLDYSPLRYNSADRKYLGNIYEPLLRFDGSFNMESALAVSWGRLDEYTWDFQLRQGVQFHTGETFDADDALYSLSLAKAQGDSELGALLSTLSEVQKTGDYRFTLRTTQPDPLLLNKLSYVYMLPEGYVDFKLPIGTGPYRVSAFSQNTLTLERFESYWGPLAFFPL